MSPNPSSPVSEVAPAGVSPTALLILGMHRSGTSAIARVLNLYGADLGEDLLPPADDNPKGFFEARSVVDLQNRWLADLGRHWEDPSPLPPDWVRSPAGTQAVADLSQLLRQQFGASPLFAIKDPRTSLFLPIWERSLEQLGTRLLPVIAVRHPLEVAASLTRRSGMPTAQGLLLWLRYQLEAEAATRAYPRLFVSYEDLLTRWPQLPARLKTHLDLVLPCTTPEQHRAVAEFLDAGLRHHRSDSATFMERQDLSPWIRDCYQWLLAAAADTLPDPTPLDAIRDGLNQADLGYRPWCRDLASGLQQQRQLAEARARVLEEHEAYHRQLQGEMQSLGTLAAERARVLEEHEVYHQQLQGEIQSQAQQLQHLQQLRQELEMRTRHLSDRVQELSRELDNIKASRFWRLRQRWQSLRRRLSRSTP